MSDLVLTMGATARINSKKVKIGDERGRSCLAADAEGLEGGCHVEGPHGWGDTPPSKRPPVSLEPRGAGEGETASLSRVPIGRCQEGSRKPYWGGG